MACDVKPGRGPGSFGQHHTAHVGLIDSDRLHGPVFPSGVKHHVTVDLRAAKREAMARRPCSHKDLHTDRGGAVGDSLLRTQRRHRTGSTFPRA